MELHCAEFLFFLILFIYLFLAELGLRCCSRAFLQLRQTNYSSLWCKGFSLRWLLLLQSMRSTCTGFSSCGSWAQQLWLKGSRAQAQQLWRMGLVVPQHVGSSQIGDRTHVPCIGKWVINHCTTREVPRVSFCHQKISINLKQIVIN